MRANTGRAEEHDDAGAGRAVYYQNYSFHCGMGVFSIDLIAK
jgi:hypothetical protein